MTLQNAHSNFIEAIVSLYPADEAENIWKMVFEHIVKKTFKHNQFADWDEPHTQKLSEIRERLLQAEPVQYILQEAWFYDIPFYVDKSVLIPRPETEELVHWIIQENTFPDPVIIDIGTGSGCIPVILKRKIPQSIVHACDISEVALAVAKKNAEQYQTKINWQQMDILNYQNFQYLPPADIIVSNPPYIPEKDKETMRLNVLLHEPHVALFVEDKNPLIFYEAIAAYGKQVLKACGRIYVEIHEELADAASKLFEKENYIVTIKQDMQKKDRFIKAVFN